MAITSFPKVSIVSARTGGVNAMRMLCGGGGGQFFTDVFYGQPPMKSYSTKNVIWTRIPIQNDFKQRTGWFTGYAKEQRT